MTQLSGGEEGRTGEVALVAGVVEQVDARRIGALADPADTEKKETLPGRA